MEEFLEEIILDASFKRRKGNGWKGKGTALWQEGMVACRREAERSTSWAGAGKTDMQQQVHIWE